MKNLEKSYLAFRSEGIFYLLRLEEVAQIIDGSQISEGEFVDFFRITGGEERDICAEHRYGILFNDQQDMTESFPKAGILVEEMEGIINAEEAEEFLLSQPLINCHNQYIRALVRLNVDRKEYVGYLLNTSQLKNTLIKPEEPDHENEDGNTGQEKNRILGQTVQLNRKRYAGLEKGLYSAGISISMERDLDDAVLPYMTLVRGGAILYIEKSVVMAVVMAPEIYKIPEADRWVQGVSFYEGQLVVYYDQLEEVKGAGWLRRKVSPACGVIFRTSAGSLAGFIGDAMGETVFSAAEASDLVSMGNGIWVKKRD